MIRFSLASLFGVVVIAGVGCAALSYANDLWRQIVVTLAVMLLLFSTLAAVLWQRHSRAFAMGFAVSGWLYLLLAFSPTLALRDDLLTDNAVACLYEKIHEEEVGQYYRPDSTFGPYGRTIASGTFQRIRIWDISGASSSSNFLDFADIGHVLWALIVGGVGGLTASFLWTRQQRAYRSDAGRRVNPPARVQRTITTHPTALAKPRRCLLCTYEDDTGASQPSGDSSCPKCGCRIRFSGSGEHTATTVLVDVARLLGVIDGCGDTRCCSELWDQFSALVVTFRDAEAVSCATIGALTLLYEQCALKSCRLLFVVSRSNSVVREVFEKLRLDTIVDICDSEQAAMDRIQS
jgi:hypothetical protein